MKTNVSTKGLAEANKTSPKWLKCFYCIKFNYVEDKCFIFHPDKRLSSARQKMLDANISALEVNFKNLASFGKILDLSASFEANASSSTPDFYMSRASREVVSLVVVTRAQSV